MTGTVTPATPPILKVDGLRVGYGGHLALFGVSFSLAPGSVMAVLGANGAGKSTLGRALAGLVPVSAGSIELDGLDITSCPAYSARRAGILYLPEGRGIFPSLTVMDNLRMAAGTIPRAERADAIARATDLFPVLGRRTAQMAGHMSGGEQQMLSLARVITASPKVLIADELSLGLAPLVVEEVFERLATFRELGIAILLIEQFVHRALALSESCILLRSGRIDWAGSASEAGDEVLAAYLG
jgi:branched-chain amino acid transport system ATP-binding protein